MSKKMNCRLTTEEREVHEFAVGLRKKTDRQLVELFDKQYKNGFEAGRLESTSHKSNLLVKQDYINTISSIKGIGTATLAKIQAAIDLLQK